LQPSRKEIPPWSRKKPLEGLKKRPSGFARVKDMGGGKGGGGEARNTSFKDTKLKPEKIPLKTL